MLRSEIFSKLCDLLVMMDASKKEIIPNLKEESRLVEDVGLASVSLLYLMIAIEESFGIEFDNLGVNDLPTIKDVIDYIEKKL